MQISCGICKDLQPLYADGLASADSRKAVRQHLSTCEECRRCYRTASIKAKNTAGAARVTTGGYCELAKRFKNRTLAAGCAALGVCAALVIALSVRDKK